VLHRRFAGDVVDEAGFEFLRRGRTRKAIVFVAERDAKRFSKDSGTNGFEDCKTGRGDVGEELRGKVFVSCFQQTTEKKWESHLRQVNAFWIIKRPIRENQFHVAHVVIYETSMDDADDFISTKRCGRFFLDRSCQLNGTRYLQLRRGRKSRFHLNTPCVNSSKLLGEEAPGVRY